MSVISTYRRAAASLTKNLISTQTWAYLEPMLNTPVFDVTYGLGISTATSIVVCSSIGGVADVQATAVMRYRSPTAAGNENFGVFLRARGWQASTVRSYYYARVQGQNARISRGDADSLTNLTSTAFALPADTDVTIVFSAVGNALTASFTASGLGTVNLSTTDSTYTDGAFNGFRTLTTAGYCSSITITELP